MSSGRKREFRGGIRMIRDGDLEQPVGSKRKRDDDDIEQQQQQPTAATNPPITLSSIEHNALRESLFDIQDEKLLRAYEFAQLIAGYLGENDMRKVWSGDDPRRMSKELPAREERAKATAGGVSANQLQQLFRIINTFTQDANRQLRDLDERTRNIETMAESATKNSLKSVVASESHDTEIADLKAQIEKLKRQVADSDMSPIGDKMGFEEGRMEQQQQITPDLIDEQFLRQVLMRRSLSPSDLEALERVTDLSLTKGERHEAVRTVWQSVSFTAALESLTPSVMAAVREGHNLLRQMRPFSLESLILGGAEIKADFAKLTSFYIKKNVSDRPGTYRASQHPNMLWQEINLLMRKFKRAQYGDDGGVYVPSPKKRKLVQLPTESGRRRGGRVLVVDGEVYNTMGGGGGVRYARSPSMRARSVSHYLGPSSQFQPDYMSEALKLL